MRWLLPLLVMLALLAGCSSAGQAPAPGGGGDTAASTPAAPGNAYPYPGPQGAPEQGPPFTLTAPILTANGTISGTGPAGVPIRLVNMMRNNAVIGETVIKADGSFSVPVTEMAQGDMIAVTLGDLTGTSFNAADFAQGPNYKEVEGIGTVFASQVVLE